MDVNEIIAELRARADHLAACGKKGDPKLMRAAADALAAPSIVAGAVELIRIAKQSIEGADPEILTDTLWASEDLMKGATVVDVLDHAIAALTPDTAARQERYQARVAAAHHALFHDDPTDVPERLARFFEEATETAQSLGMSHFDAYKLVDYVYGRPVGEPRKEIGAAMLTLASLCVVAGYDMEACGEADLQKLVQPATVERIRAKRATRHGRGPLPGIDPAKNPVDVIQDMLGGAELTPEAEAMRKHCAEPVCAACAGSGIRFVNLGHGNIGEEPCDVCGGEK